jgi:hypothetical protein
MLTDKVDIVKGDEPPPWPSNPVDIVVCHPCEVVDDEPDTGDKKLTDNQAKKEGAGAVKEGGTTILEDDGFDQPSQKYRERQIVAQGNRTDRKAEWVDGPPQEIVSRQHQKSHDRGAYACGNPTDPVWSIRIVEFTRDVVPRIRGTTGWAKEPAVQVDTTIGVTHVHDRPHGRHDTDNDADPNRPEQGALVSV